MVAGTPWSRSSRAPDPYRVDLMGYGNSPAPRGPCTLQSHVTAIRATLQEAGMDPPYSLVGLSMGSNLRPGLRVHLAR